MTLQLIDNTWELKVDNTLDANVPIHNLGTYTNNFVVVNIVSGSALTPWQQAGSISQAVNFDNDFAHGKIKQITLNSYLLLQFPLITGDSYDLYYFPLSRLVEVEIKVWEYKGTTTDILLESLVDKISNLPAEDLINIPAIETSLDCIKSDLAIIKDYLGISPPSPPINSELFFLFN